MLSSLKKAYRLFHRQPDERIVAESNRIYTTGFWLLVVGYLLYVWHGWMLTQVAYVNELEPTFDASAFASPFMNAWLLVVFAAVTFLLWRKGIYSSAGLEECDLFPVEASLGSSLASALVMFVSATLMRAFAEFELMGLAGVNLLHNVVIASVFAMEVFVLVLMVIAFSYFAAQRRRKRAEAEEDR